MLQTRPTLTPLTSLKASFSQLTPPRKQPTPKTQLRLLVPLPNRRRQMIQTAAPPPIKTKQAATRKSPQSHHPPSRRRLSRQKKTMRRMSMRPPLKKSNRARKERTWRVSSESSIWAGKPFLRALYRRNAAHRLPFPKVCMCDLLVLLLSYIIAFLYLKMCVAS